jgi:ABC-type branched-subunit amino acid transport system ATPase component
MLTVEKATKHFGGLVALKDVSLSVKKNEIVGLIGPNGSGKTTLFNLITKVYPLTGGEIRFGETALSPLPPNEVCYLGIARTHQIPRPFKNLTAEENVILAYLYGKHEKRSRAEAAQKALELLTLVGLEHAAGNPAGHLNDVECKMLELARCLATRPQLLLLDEILAGLNMGELQRFRELILRIRGEMGITVFWCEHIMRVIMGTADRIVCLDHGQKICDGKPEEVANNEQVIDSYLGRVKGA